MLKEKKETDYSLNRIFALIAGSFMIISGIFHKNGPVFKIISILSMLCALAAMIISVKPKTAERFFNSFRLNNFSKKKYYIAGPVIGIIFAFIYRFMSGYALFPLNFGLFILPAVMIGASEELIFRGYIQKNISFKNRIIPVMTAAFFHTAYKAFIFADKLNALSIIIFCTITFTGGLIFGLTTELSDNVLPAVTGHALFDLLVYGGLNTAPWWVW